LRGGNDNPGRREGFLGEVDDVLAAADHLSKLPHIDPTQIYLGGHSTGGTLALLVAECSNTSIAIRPMSEKTRCDHHCRGCIA
jgi:dipeptidyl aminopeptidase/acylaminoacyl peptidase